MERVNISPENSAIVEAAERKIFADNSPTRQEIADQVGKTSKEVWDLINERSKEFFGNARRSAWLYRGRVIHSLFQNHFKYVLMDAAEILHEKEQEIANGADGKPK